MQRPCEASVSVDALGCLCREAEGLRSRLVRIDADQARCQNPALCRRLQRESEQLFLRLAELRRLGQWLQSAPVAVDRLTLSLFQELCRRPLPSS